MLQPGKRQSVPLEQIKPDPEQPRLEIEGGKIEEMAQSLRELGQLQPINVRPAGDGGFIIITGERRFRGTQKNLELARATNNKELEKRSSTLDVIVRTDLSPIEIFEMQAVENQERLGFTDLERALGFERLVYLRSQMTRKSLSSALRAIETDGELSNQTREAVEKALTTFRVSAATARKNLLPLIEMPEDIRQAVKAKKCGAAAAGLLNRVEDQDAREALIRKLEGGLSVRELESEVTKLIQSSSSNNKKLLPIDELRGLIAQLKDCSEHLKPFSDKDLRVVEEAIRKLRKPLDELLKASPASAK
jgi:ParB family transcriptional regulator, chromosome partitioning protein